MDKNPKVSIIIPAYNAQAYIKDTLISCCKQSYINIEIIVIDDGSTDATLEVIKGINSNKIIVISQKNQGVTAAREKGIRYCNGQYLFFLDSDDILDENAVKILLLYSFEHNADVTIGQSKSFGHGVSKKSKYIEGVYKEPFSQFLMCNLPFTLWPSLYRKELFNDLNYDYDLKVGEDYMINSQIMGKSSLVVVCKNVIHYYRRHKDSVTATCSKSKFFDSYKSFQYVIEFGQNSGLPVKNEIIFHQVQYLHSQLFAGSPYALDIKKYTESNVSKYNIELSLINMGVPKYKRFIFKWDFLFLFVNVAMRQIRKYIQKVRFLI